MSNDFEKFTNEAKRSTQEIYIKIAERLNHIVERIDAFNLIQEKIVIQNEARDKLLSDLKTDMWDHSGVKNKVLDHAIRLEGLRDLPEKVHEHARKIVSHEEKIGLWTKVTGTVASILFGSLIAWFFKK